MDEKEQQPSIAVFGLGYVGCVTAACFAELGYRITGVDVDARKVRAIQDGQSPFYEPGLDDLIAKHRRSGLLVGYPLDRGSAARGGLRLSVRRYAVSEQWKP